MHGAAEGEKLKCARESKGIKFSIITKIKIASGQCNGRLNTVARRLHDPDAKSEDDTETTTQRKTSASDHSAEVTQDILTYLQSDEE